MIGSKHDWANLNTLRSYPFVYSKNPSSDTGFVLEDEILSDLIIIAQASDYVPRLSSIHFSKNIISLCFFDVISNEDSFILQTTIGSSYSLESIINVGSVLVSGSGTFGDLSSFSSYMDTGIHRFSLNEFIVDSHCVFVAGPPVIFSISGGLATRQGDVAISTLGRLRAASTTVDDGFGNLEHNIIFSLANAEEFLEKCPIPENICECPIPPLEKINTVSPDQNGNINIISDGLEFNVLEIENYQNNIIISAVGSSKEVCDLGLPSSEGLLPSEQEQ
jgi:hypothetical protein